MRQGISRRKFIGGLATSAVALAAPAKAAEGRVTVGINEGAAGSLDASEILLRYEPFRLLIEKTLARPVSIIALRDAAMLRERVTNGSLSFVMSRPVDVLAEAVRDHEYQPVVIGREVGRALFIVNKDSPLKALPEVKGKSIVTPDRHSYIWRVANAMLRDQKIALKDETVKAMRDQAAIGWSMENGFFDVGVVASYSGVGRGWEKKGGRVLAKSRDLPTTPLIASSAVSGGDISKLRAALVATSESDSGLATLKQIGIPGFRSADSAPFLDLLKWLGDLPQEAKKA